MSCQKDVKLIGMASQFPQGCCKGVSVANKDALRVSDLMILLSLTASCRYLMSASKDSSNEGNADGEAIEPDLASHWK